MTITVDIGNPPVTGFEIVDPIEVAFEAAPLDPRPLSEETRNALRVSRQAVARGESVALTEEEVRRRLRS